MPCRPGLARPGLARPGLARPGLAKPRPSQGKAHSPGKVQAGGSTCSQAQPKQSPSPSKVLPVMERENQTRKYKLRKTNSENELGQTNWDRQTRKIELWQTSSEEQTRKIGVGKSNLDSKLENQCKGPLGWQIRKSIRGASWIADSKINMRGLLDSTPENQCEGPLG